MPKFLQLIDPDRMLPEHTGNKIKMLMLLAHIYFVAWAFSDEFSWLFLIIATPFLWFFVGKMGMEVGYHRLWCHRSFTTYKWVEYLLLILGVVSNAGSCITWVGMHRIHHQKADHKGDPQNNHTHTRWQLWLTFFGKDWITSPRTLKDLIHDPKQRFFHRNYFKLALAYIAICSVISYLVGSWYPVIVAWAIPVVSNFNAAGFLNAHFHRNKQKNWKPLFHYRNFETEDDSLNSHLNWLMAGGGLHNNHHAHQGSHTYNLFGRWWEPDLTGWFVKNVLATSVVTVELPDPLRKEEIPINTNI
jgi:fatty-acid desaturase